MAKTLIAARSNSQKSMVLPEHRIGTSLSFSAGDDKRIAALKREPILETNYVQVFNVRYPFLLSRRFFLLGVVVTSFFFFFWRLFYILQRISQPPFDSPPFSSLSLSLWRRSRFYLECAALISAQPVKPSAPIPQSTSLPLGVSTREEKREVRFAFCDASQHLRLASSYHRSYNTFLFFS